MNFYNVLKEVSKTSGISQRQIGLTLGHSTGYVANMRNSGVPTVDTANRLLNVCGFALCAVPRDAITDDMYEITQTRKVDQ